MADLLTSSPVMADGDMPSMPDPIFNRLLKDRIIWMGEEVKDDTVSYTHLTLPTKLEV